MNNVVLHEFGHAVGLHHEQDRKDSVCDVHTGFITGERREVGETYDDLSIMNACAPDYYSKKMRLSDGDIAAVNYLYSSVRDATQAADASEYDACGECKDLESGEVARVCGVKNRDTNKWVASEWVLCGPQEFNLEACEPCGKETPGLRFCGSKLPDKDAYRAGKWIRCVGKSAP